MALSSYLQFKQNPSRRDIYLFDVVVKNAAGVEENLYWCTSRPPNAPEIAKYQPRVVDGGLNYVGPNFDPHNPTFGALPPSAPEPLVIFQWDGDMDDKRTHKWDGASITVRHGGYTQDGWLPLSEWRVINTVEVDRWPTFSLDRVSFPLRTMDARFKVPMETRKLAALGWCIEGDGATAGVNFSPFAPGVRERARSEGRVGDGVTNIVIDKPEGTQAGDLMRAYIAAHMNDNNGTYQAGSISSAPAGWTLQQAALASASGDPAMRLYLYTKVAGASEPATYQWNWTGTNCARCWSCVAYYGQDGTTPVVTSAESSPDTRSAAAAAPTVTTTRTNDLLDCGWSSQNGDQGVLPQGMTRTCTLRKKTTTSNSSTLVTAYEKRPSVGATGTRTLTLPGNSHWCAIACVIGNRASGGVPTKLALLNTLSLQFGFVYLASGTQHIYGWEISPFRVFLTTDGNMTLSWQKASVTVSKTSSFAFVVGRRYHVEWILTDTSVTLLVYDWFNDEERDPEVFTGTGFTGRDTYGLGDEFTALYNNNNGAPNEFARIQLWSIRLWNVAKSQTFLQNTRMRPLTDAEKYDTTLVHYLTFEEKTGDIVGDGALDPADGVLNQTTTGATTLSVVGGTGQRITRGAGSFVTDGWVAGRMFEFAGLTKTANVGRGVVKAVTALNLYVDGMVLVDETGNGDETLVSRDWRPTLTGTVDQLGQEVPNVWGGPAEGVPGIPVESAVDGVFWMFHPAGIFDFMEVAEGGAGRIIAVDHTDYSRFVAAYPEIGTITTYSGPLGSFVRARTIPTLPLTAKLKGEASDGTFRYTGADLVAHAMSTRGDNPIEYPAGFDTASIATLNTKNSSPLSTVVGNGETIEDFSRRILGSIGAVTWQTRDGKQKFARWEGNSGASSRVVHRKIVKGGFVALEPMPPVKEMSMFFRRNWMKLERDQVSGQVTNTNQLAFLMEEWRTNGVQKRWQVTRDHLRARTMEVFSCFCDPWNAWRHAGEETDRTLDLYEKPPAYFEVEVRSVDTPTEFFDLVRLDIQDLDRNNELRYRLGTPLVYVVVHVADNRRFGTERLRLWAADGTTESGSAEEGGKEG